MTPDEIAALPPDAAIVFLKGEGLRPILAQRISYFQDPEYAGKYVPPSVGLLS